jgi:hypothetical protein
MNRRTVRGGRLTRKGAAEVLGVSVGTVRRLEGTVLHPLVDAGGIHLFEVSEVENVARESLGLCLRLPSTPSLSPTRHCRVSTGVWQTSSVMSVNCAARRGARKRAAQ